uniref:Uncharacterized protein n=1 Tax=Triticum urartu TaxID=4572 RepID=A0A8R7Q9J7_TRIUA
MSRDQCIERYSIAVRHLRKYSFRQAKRSEPQVQCNKRIPHNSFRAQPLLVNLDMNEPPLLKKRSFSASTEYTRQNVRRGNNTGAMHLVV